MQSESKGARFLAYLDFELEIGAGSGREYPVAVIRSPAGEARETMRFPFDELALENRLKDLQIGLLRSGGKRRQMLSSEEQTVQDFGRALLDALLTGEVRSRYDVSWREAKQQGKGLRLKLRIQPPELAALPWEFLYDPRQAEYVCLSRGTPVVRYLELPQPIQPLTVTPPLHILGMIASPRDLPLLDVVREKQRVEEAVKDLRARGMVDLTWLAGQTWRDLQRAMRGGPRHIFHFIGHGGFDRNADQGLIALADEDGLSALMHATELGRLLADHDSLRLVLLNSCEGARGGERDIFSSTASILVRRGIPAVVAMQYPITDRAAIEFSRAFYESLADGLPVDAAVSEARKAISLAVANTMEWGTPVLYMRSPQGVIFQIPETRSTRPPIPRRPPEADRELEHRLEQLYTEGLAAFWVEDWDKAGRSFQAIVDTHPDFADAKTKLEQAKRQERLNTLYAQAQTAQAAKDWPGALGALEALVAEAANYKDAAALLKSARQQKQLADLYAEARRLHQAQQWQAVANVFAQITATQPDYADPDGLLPTAEREVATLKRKAELDALYSRAVRAMDAGRWQDAQKLLKQVKEQELAFRETERLLARTEAELAHEQQERQRQEQIATLYEQATGLARARQWRQALAKMQEIFKLDAQFADSDKISTRAQEEVAREEQEAQRQNETAASYAEAVRLLRDGQYQKALEKWAEVQARDPKYPDRQHVQSTAKKKLDALAQVAPGKFGVSKQALAVMGGMGLLAVVVAFALLSRLGGGAVPAVETHVPGIVAPLPMSTATFGADPTMYDDFDNLAYDGNYNKDRWDISTDYPTSKMAQQNGMFVIATYGYRHQANLFARSYRNMALKNPTFIEAKIKLDPYENGGAGISCGPLDKGSALCQIWGQGGGMAVACQGYFFGQQIDIASKIVTPGTWHTVRIETDPGTMTFTYIIDSQEVGAYTPSPSQVDELKKLAFSFFIGSGCSGDGCVDTTPRIVTGYFDYVRIGPVGP